MDKIPSFTINHLELEPGVYVSRRDFTRSGNVITTFDVRMTRPNREPAMTPQALHAMEHIAATFLRNHPDWSPRIVYWGPMGCCTGNYLIIQGDLEAREVIPLVRETMQHVAQFSGPVPGASPRDCGNYSFMDLDQARQAAKKFLAEDWQTHYPD